MNGGVSVFNSWFDDSVLMLFVLSDGYNLGSVSPSEDGSSGDAWFLTSLSRFFHESHLLSLLMNLREDFGVMMDLIRFSVVDLSSGLLSSLGWLHDSLSSDGP